MSHNQRKTAADENVDLDALIAELETPTPSTQDKNAVVSEVNENKDDEIVVEFPEDQEDEKAWGKWFIENGRSGMDKELARERFFKRRKEEREKREERNRIIGTGPAPEDLNLPRIH